MTVKMPVRLRLDAGTDPDEVERALTAALARSISASGREVPSQGRPAALAAPTVSWREGSLDAVGPEAGAEIVRAVHRSVAAAARLAGAQAGSAGPAAGSALPVPRWAEPGAGWGGDEWVLAFVEAYAANPPQLGSTDLVGLIYRLEEGYGVRAFRLLDRDRVVPGTVEALEGVFRIIELHASVAQVHGIEVTIAEVGVDLAPGDSMSLRWLSGSAAARHEALLRHKREIVAGALEPARQRLVAALGPAAFARLVEAKAGEEVERLEADPRTRSFAVLGAGEDAYLVASRGEAPPVLGENPLPLVALTEEAPVAPPAPDGGEGAAGGGDAGDGDGETGDGEEDGSERAGFVLGDGGSDESGVSFPVAGGDGGTLTCESFLGEPSLAELGEDGERLRERIAAVAARLDVEPCDFGGQFCLNAALALGARALAVGAAGAGESGGILKPPAAAANLGAAEFEAAASPARQLLRHLAATVPVLNALSADLVAAYMRPEHRGTIEEPFGDPTRWAIRFGAGFNGSLIESVGFLFGATCQVLMAQLLRSSREAIEDRRSPEYAELFERTMLPRLERLGELLGWREEIRRYETVRAMAMASDDGNPVVWDRPNAPAAATPPPPTPAATPAGNWPAAREALLDSLRPAEAPPPAELPGHRRGEVVDDGRVVGVDDGSGRVWTLAAIESALVTRRGTLESIDPLVKQLADLPEALGRLRGDREHARETLASILAEMLTRNEETSADVRGSWEYSFRASRIREGLPGATVPGTGFSLQGVHRLAHEAIGDAFGGDVTYALAIRSLFEGELNRSLGLTLIEFTGLVLAGIVCAPLAAALGVGLAAYHYEEALERERLYGSLIDPELVLSRVEVEVELFAARLGLALAFLGEAGSILRSGERVGVAMTQHLAEQLERGLAVALVREVAKAELVGKLIELAVQPLIASLEREVLVAGPQGGLDAALQHRLALLPPAPGVVE
ncbi:MAG TPA: hypothetical protein VF245_06870 [Solirubrobacterales bacterium]